MQAGEMQGEVESQEEEEIAEQATLGDVLLEGAGVCGEGPFGEGVEGGDAGWAAEGRGKHGWSMGWGGL